MRLAILAGVLAVLCFGPGITRAMAQWSPHGYGGSSYHGYPGLTWGYVPGASGPGMLGSFGAVGGYHFRGIYGSYAPTLHGVYPYYYRTSLGGYPGGFYYGGFPRLYNVGPYARW